MPELKPKNDKPTVHNLSPLPVCSLCKSSGVTRFNFDCAKCMERLKSSKTTISELFAILRIWTSSVQQNISIILNLIFQRGANINDRDGLTDLTLLHYACKAGANHIGDENIASKIITDLITKGADVTARSRWTDMTPLHYASFFNCSNVINVLAKTLTSSEINAKCSSFDDGTSLHIAANNLCRGAVIALLGHGANPNITNNLNRSALEVVPDVVALGSQAEAVIIAKDIQEMLQCGNDIAKMKTIRDRIRSQEREQQKINKAFSPLTTQVLKTDMNKEVKKNEYQEKILPNSNNSRDQTEKLNGINHSISPNHVKTTKDGKKSKSRDSNKKINSLDEDEVSPKDGKKNKSKDSVKKIDLLDQDEIFPKDIKKNKSKDITRKIDSLDQEGASPRESKKNKSRDGSKKGDSLNQDDVSPKGSRTKSRDTVEKMDSSEQNGTSSKLPPNGSNKKISDTVDRIYSFHNQDEETHRDRTTDFSKGIKSLTQNDISSEILQKESKSIRTIEKMHEMNSLDDDIVTDLSLSESSKNKSNETVQSSSEYKVTKREKSKQSLRRLNSLDQSDRKKSLVDKIRSISFVKNFDSSQDDSPSDSGIERKVKKRESSRTHASKEEDTESSHNKRDSNKTRSSKEEDIISSNKKHESSKPHTSGGDDSLSSNKVERKHEGSKTQVCKAEDNTSSSKKHESSNTHISNGEDIISSSKKHESSKTHTSKGEDNATSNKKQESSKTHTGKGEDNTSNNKKRESSKGLTSKIDDNLSSSKRSSKDKIDRNRKSRSSGDRRSSDKKSLKETILSFDFKPGDTVRSGSKVGKLCYFGRTEFADGIWAGIKLDEPIGKNDGTVDGVTYFSCKPKHGILVNASRVQKVTDHTTSDSNQFSDLIPNPSEIKNIFESASDSSQLQSNPDEISVLDLLQLKYESSKIRIGDRVIASDDKPGVVRFVGKTKFASGTWIGIELDEELGKNDGSTAGVRYFTCKPRHGVFLPPSKVMKDLNYYYAAKLQKESDLQAAQAEKARLIKNANLPDENKNRDVSASKSSISDSVDTVLRNSKIKRESDEKAIAMNLKLKTNTNNSLGKSDPNSSSITVTTGMSAYVNSDIGIIRFIGYVEPLHGNYLGIELRKPKGTMDGTYEGKKYFACKPNHGLLVKPSAVTVRGINAAELIEE
ncbi:CAP-Gly domain-containing linker protein 3 [Trichoplax sp. H2]|nr:CAP-Gly domain-containing linker protein 3 [Trichoplax sp. H2]|eukprot:RDD45439.1 CAP-Gly domain-containing linker protein 3 [Trichoplax sp. H2]